MPCLCASLVLFEGIVISMTIKVFEIKNNAFFQCKNNPI